MPAPKPVISKKANSDGPATDTRRKCVRCKQPLGSARTTFTNYNGSIGKAHEDCQPSEEN